MTETAPPIKGLQNGQDAPREGELLKRRHRRRNDLATLAGISREETRLYYLMMAGKLSLAHYEIASRGLARHAATTRQLEEVRQVDELQERLAALQRPAAALPAPASAAALKLPAWAREPARTEESQEPQP